MKSPQRIVWSEGILVSQHHLQQQDRYHEYLLNRRAAALTPHAWGMIAAEIDRHMLRQGQVRIEHFSGVLPDGMYLDLDDGAPETPPARPIDKHFSPTRPSLDVFLGVIRERHGVANLPEHDGASRPTRFDLASEAVLDTSTGAGEREVTFAQPRVSILFGDEAREDYETIKLAEIVRDAQGGLVVGDAYIPPVLRLGAAPSLVERLKSLVALAVGKQNTLLAGRRQRDGATVEFTASDVTRYLLLSAVSQFIPVLNHVVESGDLAPRDVYLLLLQFTGALSPFSLENDAALPPFSHTDLRASFDGVLSRLSAQLGATVKENFIRVPLEARPDGGHFGRLEDDRTLRARHFVLAVESHLPEAQTAELLPKLSKIASWKDINPIVQAASPGVPVSVTHRPPPEIPVRAGQVYFTLGISESDRVWRGIVEERRLAVYLPPPFVSAQTRVQLLCVPQPSMDDR